MKTPANLTQLEEAIGRDLAYLNFPPDNWVVPHTGPDGRPVLDVLIVGAGMCGLAAGFALRRFGVSNIHTIDAAPAGLEGPWISFARMKTLRSPKHLTGPALGLPGLTFRAWFEVQFGAKAWEQLGRIPRTQWAQYMNWYGRVIGARVESDCRLASIEPGGDHLQAELQRAGTSRMVRARRIVLATGRDAMARPRIPTELQEFIGAQVFHTSSAPGPALFKDRRVIVIGLAASAFDYAAEALESGATSVTMLGRSNTIPRVNKAKQVVYAGFSQGLCHLPDRDRLAIFTEIFADGIPPPRDSVFRVTAHDNFKIQLGAGIEYAERQGDAIKLTTEAGTFEADIVVLGTGFHVEAKAAPFLGNLGDNIKTWRDAVPDGQKAGELLDFPYLDEGFAFVARNNGAAGSAVTRLHSFNHTAMVSLGNLANDIPAVSEGAEQLARSIATRFFIEDQPELRARLRQYDDPELLGDEFPDLPEW